MAWRNTWRITNKVTTYCRICQVRAVTAALILIKEDILAETVIKLASLKLSLEDMN